MSDKEQNNTEVWIAVYNATRQSLENKSSAQNTLFIYAFTLTGAILSFSLQQANPYIALMSFAVLITVRCRVMWFRNAYIATNVRLRKEIEPKLGISIRKTKELKSVAMIQYFVYSFLGAGAILTYFINNPHNTLTFIAILLLFVVVVALDIYYYTSWRWLYRKYEAMWEN